MRFKTAIFLITILFLKKELYADGCNNGAFSIIQNCNTPLQVCFNPGGTSDQPPDTQYSWDWGDGTSTSYCCTAGNTCHTFPAIGSYTVTLTLDVDLGFFGGHKICVSSALIDVTITQPPVLTITDPSPVCDPGTIDITGAAVTAGSTGSGTLSYWTDAAATIPLLNPSAITVAGTYYIQSTIPQGCDDIKPVVVSFYPTSLLTITDPPPVCSPETVDITAASVSAGSVGAGTLSYWTDLAATITLTSASAVPSNGTYYIKIITSPGGCIDVKPVVVVIKPLPVSDAGPDIVICTGGIGTIGATASLGQTYSWNPTSGLTTSTDANPTITLSNAGPAPTTSTYTLSTTEAGCVSTDVVNITVNAIATANAGSTQTLCPGQGITLSGSLGGTATSGTWSGGTGTYSPNNTTLNAVYTPSAAEYAVDSVKLTLTTNDPAGPCTFSSSEVIFRFYKNPVVDFSVNDPQGCPIHCVDFTDLTTVGGGATISTWTWNFGDNSASSPTQDPSHCYSQTGFYDVTLTATSSNNCTTTLTIPQMIQVFQLPIAEFNPTPNPATVIAPTITFNNQSSTDVNYWSWNFGDGDSLVPGSASPEHTYPNAVSSSYNATLIVHNADGCYDTVMHEIFIGPEYSFFIPNSFTPNGDGINDYFYGSGIGIIDYDLWVFDRWGNMIFIAGN